MLNHELVVRNVAGRYPESGVLRGRNIVATVTEVARVYLIRLDDSENPDAWLELTIEFETQAAPWEQTADT